MVKGWQSMALGTRHSALGTWHSLNMKGRGTKGKTQVSRKSLWQVEKGAKLPWHRNCFFFFFMGVNFFLFVYLFIFFFFFFFFFLMMMIWMLVKGMRKVSVERKIFSQFKEEGKKKKKKKKKKKVAIWRNFLYIYNRKRNYRSYFLLFNVFNQFFLIAWLN